MLTVNLITSTLKTTVYVFTVTIKVLFHHHTYFTTVIGITAYILCTVK